MAGIKEISIGRSDIFKLDPNLLKIMDNWNVRLPGPAKDEHVRYLANSIKEIGVKIPLVIRMIDEIPHVVDGECRLLGTLLAISEGADIKTIPVMMEDRYASDEDRVMTMLTCNEGKPFTLAEKAEAYKRLVAWGWDEAKIAQKSGISVQAVKTALNFSALSPELKQLVNDGKVSATLVTEMVAEIGMDKALEKIKKAVEIQNGKKATKKHVKKVTEEQNQNQNQEPGLEMGSGSGTANNPPEKKYNWKVYGPKLKAMLEKICDAPITDKAKVQGAIAEGMELLGEMDR